MKHAIVGTLMLFCLLIPCHADDTVPAPLHLKVTPATTQFLRAFTAYAQAVKDQGAQGVKKLTTADFSLRQGKQSAHGKEAFQELAACMDDFPKDGFTASVRPLSVSDTKVVALTRETFQMQLGSTRASAIYYRKQTWRMTPEGWKLAVIEIQDAEDFDNTAGLGFTVTPETKGKPAKAQGNPTVVE